jgi:hypothetical protein
MAGKWADWKGWLQVDRKETIQLLDQFMIFAEELIAQQGEYIDSEAAKFLKDHADDELEFCVSDICIGMHHAGVDPRDFYIFANKLDAYCKSFSNKGHNVGDELKSLLEAQDMACLSHMLLYVGDDMPWGEPADKGAIGRQIKPRFTPPTCPKCKGKATVQSTRPAVRHLKCTNDDCGHTWLLAK